ncbi:MAG: hypothetical protein MI924_23295 [Chloroflexales bacterium]|nr:hypothetical protein [Chloroflexales bacterium]
MVPPKPVRWQATQWNSQSHIKILVLGIFFLLSCLIGGCDLFHPFRPTTRARTDLTMYLVTAADLPAGWSEEATSPYGADGTFLRGNDLHNILRSFVTDAAVPRRVTHTIKEYESTIVAQESFDAYLAAYTPNASDSATGVQLQSQVAHQYNISCIILAPSGAQPFGGDMAEVDDTEDRIICEAAVVYDTFLSIFISDIDRTAMTLRQFEEVIHQIDQRFADQLNTQVDTPYRAAIEYGSDSRF